MSKIKNDGLDQYGVGLFEQQQFSKVGIEGVKAHNTNRLVTCPIVVIPI